MSSTAILKRQTEQAKFYREMKAIEEETRFIQDGVAREKFISSLLKAGQRHTNDEKVFFFQVRKPSYHTILPLMNELVGVSGWSVREYDGNDIRVVITVYTSSATKEDMNL